MFLVLAALIGGIWFVVMGIISKNTSNLPTASTYVTVYHDDTRAVTCWIWNWPGNAASAISCLPDAQIED
jgi:hypothetical protein